MPDIVSNLVQVHPWRIDGDRLLHLVLRRSETEEIHPGIWQVITGTIEIGEGSRAGAFRELHEETGLVPIGYHPFSEPAVFYFALRDLIVISPVFAVEISDDACVVLSDEHSEFRWLDCESAVGLLEFKTHREWVIAIEELWRTNRLNCESARSEG